MGHRIRAVAEIVGVPRPTLVAWERRFAFLDEARMEDGHRLYSDRDLQALLRIKALLDEGMRISKAIEQWRAESGT